MPANRAHLHVHAIAIGLISFAFSAVDACPASINGDPLHMVIIGNSYLGGSSIGRACDDEPQPSICQNMACPGDIAQYEDKNAYYANNLSYPTSYDRPPDKDTTIDPTKQYHPNTNPHRGDVPGKMRLIAQQICGDGGFVASPSAEQQSEYESEYRSRGRRRNRKHATIERRRSLNDNSQYNPSVVEYVQNTQSRFTTRVHAGQASSNKHQATLRLLDTYNGQTGTSYDVVVVQPQSTELLKGATSTRVQAMSELLRTDRAAAQPDNSTRYAVIQTWPRRESTKHNQICSTTTEDGDEKTGMIDSIDEALADMKDLVSTQFDVVPIGSAFVEFAKLACPGIMSEGQCAFDASVDCPIWFGQEGKVSLFEEDFGEDGSHQSEDVGAWLAAVVLYGAVQSATPCFVPESEISKIMPTPSNLASIPSGMSVHNLVADAARLALAKEFGFIVRACGTTNRIAPTGTTGSEVLPMSAAALIEDETPLIAISEQDDTADRKSTNRRGKSNKSNESNKSSKKAKSTKKGPFRNRSRKHKKAKSAKG